MKDFFYDELNKELEINANLDEDAGTISGTLTNDSNSQLTGNLNESQDITECIYGKLNNLVELQEYKGWTSETIEVIVDNKYHIIKANLLTASFASKEYVDEKIKILRQYTDEQLNKVNVSIDNLVLKTDETNRQVNQIKLDLSSLDEALQKEIQDRTNAINTEATTRKEEDDKLAQSISDETNARIEQDTVLLNSINSEIEERNKADASLQDKIDKESATRKTADQALQSGIDSNLEKINQEIQDRTNADNTLQSNIDNLSNTKLDKSNANRNVLTETELTYDGDNVYSKHDYVNLATSEENTQEYLFKLATDTTAGLMATADYKSIRDLQARVQNLEAKTTRLLYTDKTNPTAAEINAFVIGEGYTSPFEGIAVVVAGTYHIWHFYEGGVGWKDDGADTVTNFTNTTSGTILGSATDGKVYAETEGTGSVYGWGQLKARVTNNETNLNNTNSKLDAEIKRSTETDEAQDTSIQDLQSQITSNDEDIANLENTKATKEALNSAVSTLTTNINNVNTELSQQLQTEVTTRENADNKLTETIESIWSSTDTSGSAQVAIAEEQRARIAEDNRIANLLTTETSSRIDADSNLQNQINTLDTNIDRNVVTATGFTYNGDNVVSTHTKTNLKTGLETQESHTFNLANQTTAGLMSTEDVKTLSDLQARVGNLENKTTRLWYSGVENPTANDINTFVTNLGYTSPFEGIAVVVEMPNGSHHIWHYYEGNIGWRDDGVDTVSLFTSENPGIVLGSIGVAGKIFAESDGTASVIGWDELKNKVSTNESNISTNTTNINSLQVNSATKEELQQAIQQEIEARTSADNTLQENINKKLDKTTDAGYRVYISNNNVNTTVAYSSNANINSMVYRDANGRSKIQNPIDDLDIANKKYVDENGGKIDTISINGTTQEIVNKNVDVDIPIIDIKFKDVSIVNDRIVDIPSNISNFTNDADYADKTYVNTYGGKIDTIKIDNTLLPITDKNIDIPIGSSSTFGVLKSNTSGIISTNGVLDLDDTVIKDNNVSTKVQSIVGQQSTLTTTSKTLVGAVNELDVDLSTLTSRVDNLNALRILNKGVIESTEANVQTVATNYIKTNYNRDPQNNDGLIITITDKNNDKVIYAYSSFSSTWISAGINQFDVADGTYTEKGIVSVAQNAGIKVDAGVLSLDPTYLSNNYLTISTDQTVAGKKLFVNAQQKVADSDYRGVLTTPLTTVNTKQYLLGQTKSTGDLKTNTNLSVYMESGKLYSNNSEVLNLSSNQTINGLKTFKKNIVITGGNGLRFSGQDAYIFTPNKLYRFFGSSTSETIAVMADSGSDNFLRPGTTDKLTLGTSTYKWKDLYLSGNLSDGTNNITVAELTKHVTIDTEQDLSAYKDFLEGLGISNTFKLKKLTGETSQTAVDCRTIDDGIYYLPKSTYFYVNTNSVTTLGEGFVIIVTKTNGGTGKYWFYFGERSSQPTIMKGYLTSTSGNYSIIQTDGFVRTNSTTTQNISCSSSTNKSILNLTGRSGNGTYLDFTNFENGVGKTCSIGINGNFEPSFIDKNGNEKSFGGITLRRWTD